MKDEDEVIELEHDPPCGVPQRKSGGWVGVHDANSTTQLHWEAIGGPGGVQGRSFCDMHNAGKGHSEMQDVCKVDSRGERREGENVPEAPLEVLERMGWFESG